MASPTKRPRRIPYNDERFHPRKGYTAPEQAKYLSRNYDAIRPTSELSDLPQPSDDEDILEADYMKWGYCLIKDALSREQLEVARRRLLDQAAAEFHAGLSHNPAPPGTPCEDRSQHVWNLVGKGQVFRDIVSFEPSTNQGGPIIERLMTKILGDGFLLSSSHGVLTGPGGGLQQLHQDQGFAPLPHPPYPLAAHLLYLYSDIDKEKGGTYIVPGSHVEEDNSNYLDIGKNRHDHIKANIVSICAPAGTCILTDGRLIHSGALRKAPGQRLVQRAYYVRSWIRQQEPALLTLPEEMIMKSSAKFRGLIGLRPGREGTWIEGVGSDTQIQGYTRKPRKLIGELSMSAPQELQCNFDFRNIIQQYRELGAQRQDHSTTAKLEAWIPMQTATHEEF